MIVSATGYNPLINRIHHKKFCFLIPVPVVLDFVCKILQNIYMKVY